MFFWFKRREDLLRYEARQLSSGEFEFCRRQLDFERRIKDEGWTGPHGWNL
jgi:hypothetical protein